MVLDLFFEWLMIEFWWGFEGIFAFCMAFYAGFRVFLGWLKSDFSVDVR